jgi:cation transport regulator
VVDKFAHVEAQRAMPYRTNDDLPFLVQSHLPPHAQDIYREAFNHAFEAHTADPRQEEAAHRIAWAAVKRAYVKIGNRWVSRTK